MSNVVLLPDYLAAIECAKRVVRYRTACTPKSSPAERAMYRKLISTECEVVARVADSIMNGQAAEGAQQ
ncbi:hypothetical protein [Caldimonas brevitalea]|uniref:Uncharacterized protein n=1 Tax=Caldimonas brevitalea TaxID=413882 RepID=A0A0G3BN49_9BURK|nr:hypothetical protein [Caldimonas brevitalea]AKJ28771.1 hypothetical protein AAW51_2080 [Caldimonas brevitalea]